MKYHAQQLPDGRWGIYQELQLLATIGCQKTCQEVLDCLKKPDQKKPKRIDLLKISSNNTRSRKILGIKAS
jgi:hypothetical protein